MCSNISIPNTNIGHMAALANTSKTELQIITINTEEQLRV